MNDLEEITTDSLFDGDLVCYQNKNGYRFSIDSVLLAHFSLSWKKATVLDLGCGCGILGLILLYRNSKEVISIDGVEIQQSLVDVARKNSEMNDFSSKLTVTAGDFRKISTLFPSESFSHVVCNPPFYRIGSGRTSAKSEEYLARHQVAATTDDIAASISYTLKNKGTFSLIFPAESAAELLHILMLRNLQAKRLQPVYSYPEAPAARLVLVEGIKNGGVGVRIMKPLYIYTTRNGRYTDEVNALYLPKRLLNETTLC
jgi:tRNA1Val (adenine37-N6)-methyltransferase